MLRRTPPEGPAREGLLSDEEVLAAVSRVRAFVANHPRRTAWIVRRTGDALDLLCPEHQPADLANCEVLDTADPAAVDGAIALLGRVTEARSATSQDVFARWHMRAARDIGLDALRALKAGVLVSQEERTSSASSLARLGHRNDRRGG